MNFNKLRFNPFAICLWMSVAIMLHIFWLKPKTVIIPDVKLRLAVAFVAIVFTLTLHELIHFFMARVLCEKKPHIKISRDLMGIPAPVTFFDGSASAPRKIIIWLAPLVLMTVGLDIAFIFMPKITLFLLIVAGSNLAGCFYDILDVLETLAVQKNRKRTD